LLCRILLLGCPGWQEALMLVLSSQHLWLCVLYNTIHVCPSNCTWKCTTVARSWIDDLPVAPIQFISGYRQAAVRQSINIPRLHTINHVQQPTSTPHHTHNCIHPTAPLLLLLARNQLTQGSSSTQATITTPHHRTS
jgi:hypothetical protein